MQVRLRGLGQLAALARAVRQRWYRLIYPDVTWGQDVVVRGRLKVAGGGRVIVGEGVIFAGDAATNKIYVIPGCTVSLGDRGYYNGVTIYACEDVVIGPDCIVADALLLTTNFHGSARDSSVPPKQGPISIGPHVWLAGRSVVLQGVTIGAEAKLTLGSVAYTDIPPGVTATTHELRFR